MKHRIAVLMLTKNSARWLDEVLTPIYQQSNKHLIHLVLMDGFSTDNTVEIAKKYFPNLVLHQQSSKNLAQLRNIALRLGEKLEPEYMCFIDSDIVVPQDFFDRAIKCLSDEKVGIVGLRFELEREPPKAFVSKFYRNRTDIKRKGVYPIDYTTTACSMWKTELSKDIVLDERLQRAGEDVDFNLQITKQGYVALVDADDPPAWHIRTPSIREELHRTKDHGFARALLLLLHPQGMYRSRKYKTFAAAILVLSGWIGLALTPIIGFWGLLPFASFFGRHWLKTKSKWRLDFAFFGFLLSVVYFTRFLQGVVKYWR